MADRVASKNATKPGQGLAGILNQIPAMGLMQLLVPAKLGGLKYTSLLSMLPCTHTLPTLYVPFFLCLSSELLVLLGLLHS